MARWHVNFDLLIDRRNNQLIQHLATVRSIARTIREIPVPPAVQERLHMLNIVRAVQGTTGIEGTHLTQGEVSDVLASDATDRVLPLTRQREEREVRNANELMRLVETTLRGEADRPLTEGLVRQFHRILTVGIEYERNVPGRYRRHDVSAGSYQTPPHQDVPGLMSDFANWLNHGAGRSLDPIVRAIVAHFLLVSIHPFGDGNGRTSRGVESYLLYQSGVNVRGFYSLANYYYQNRNEYVRLLDHVRFHSDPDVTPFVMFALNGLVIELEQVHSELLTQMTIVAFKDHAYAVMSANGRLDTSTGIRQLMFLLELGDESVAVSSLRSGGHPLSSHYSNVGSRTLSRDLNQLKDLGLISVEGGIVSARTEVLAQFSTR